MKKNFIWRLFLFKYLTKKSRDALIKDFSKSVMPIDLYCRMRNVNEKFLMNEVHRRMKKGEREKRKLEKLQTDDFIEVKVGKDFSLYDSTYETGHEELSEDMINKVPEAAPAQEKIKISSGSVAIEIPVSAGIEKISEIMKAVKEI